MIKSAKLFITDTYFNVFNVLTDLLDGKTNSLFGKNLIFCEEKISLMAERRICDRVGGSFNTDVYSFGNFLRAKVSQLNALSKEGSVMAVKNILNTIPLNCFNKSRINLAAPLFELIVQLKSANVSPEDLSVISDDGDELLKDKLKDVQAVYSAYEKFMAENGFTDQSIALADLPKIIEEDEEIKNSDVYLLGYTSFTAQAREVVSALIKNAKSVTAILTGGKNPSLYLGETVKAFNKICQNLGVKVEEENVFSDICEESKIILESVFDPSAKTDKIFETDKIVQSTAKTVREEVERIGETIKGAVITRGLRYGAFSVALSDAASYKEDIKAVFNKLKIPFFLDMKRKPDANPLITLIYAYCDVFRKNFERSALCSFFKNPLVEPDKDFTDAFGKYLIRFGVNFSAIKNPFTLGFADEAEKEKFENFRKYVCSFFERFNVRELLIKLNAEEKLKQMSAVLKDLGEREEAEENAQIFGAVDRILSDMERLLKDTSLSVYEWKNVFKSGVSALELSIIPQYSDAVFIGGYKEIALAKAKYLFFPGLNSNVPSFIEDVALLSDKDINRLSEFKVMVEPKIQIVNDRIKENLGLALASFSDGLILSYPLNSASKSSNAESELIRFFSDKFTVKRYAYQNKYLTPEQGLSEFAKLCDDFAEQKINDFSVGAAYYNAAKSDIYEKILAYSNKELKIRLGGTKKDLIDSIISPTLIETYHNCPYRAFMERIIRVKSEETGDLDALSVGNLIHNILEVYVKALKDNLYSVTDRASSDAAVDKIAREIIEADEDTKRFTLEPTADAKLKRTVKEAKRICYKVFSDIKNSSFIPVATEKKVEVKINNGKYTLTGKIDRVDEYKNYFRIIDYKTGGVDDAEKALFAGIKLQLFLYASYFKDKDLAGAYYLRAAEKYTADDKKKDKLYAGKTLDEEDALFAQDKAFALPVNTESENLPIKRDKDGTIKNTLSKSTMANYIKYAIKISELAALRMSEGYIPASAHVGACNYCPFSGFCGGEAIGKRNPKKVDSTTFDKLFTDKKDEKA